jgi:hypothetical protein
MRAFGLTVLMSLCLVLSAKDASAVSLKNFRELAAFYSAATNVPLTETKVQQAYQNVKTRLPKTGAVDEFSSPTVLGAIELSGAICNAFITAEAAAPAANRRAHQGIDFLKTTSQLADADILAVLKTYAKLFWLRDAKPAEEKAFSATITKLKSITPDTAPGARQLFLTTCTQVATSLDALITR